MHNVQAVILAGGLATRMGGVDKGLLQLHGRPILAEVIERIAPQVSGVVLNANGDPARFSEYGLPVIADSKQGFLGPLAGVLAAMEWATGQGSEWVVSVAADTPFFPVDLVARLHEAAEEHASPVALAASYDLHNASYMRHPTFGLWHISLHDVLAQALDDGVRKIVRWTDAVGGIEVRFEREATAPDPFFNVNTPQELEIAEMMRMG
jgi:molybdenum cofactor guanylyltransferase